MSDVSVVRAFMDAFNAWDVQKALTVIHDDVEVSEPAGLPTGGEYHGKEAFVGFLQSVAETYTVNLHSTLLFDADEFTLALIDTTWTSKATGVSLSTQFCELYTVTDGMITKINVFPKDTRALYELTVAAH